MPTMCHRSNPLDNLCRLPAPTVRQSVHPCHPNSLHPLLAVTTTARSIRGLGQPSNESAADVRGDRTADAVWWKNRRENGLMRDQPVLAGPLFATPEAQRAARTVVPSTHHNSSSISSSSMQAPRSRSRILSNVPLASHLLNKSQAVAHGPNSSGKSRPPEDLHFLQTKHA